jgi:hypothetical protein
MWNILFHWSLVSIQTQHSTAWKYKHILINDFDFDMMALAQNNGANFDYNKIFFYVQDSNLV